jgi:hypothetical protein
VRTAGARAWSVVRLGPIAGWFVVVIVMMATLGLSHWAAMATPPRRDATLNAGLAELLRARPGWVAVHVLYSECRCSQRIVDHLVESTRPERLDEIVLLVGDDGELGPALRRAGFHVVPATAAELATRYQIEGAPTFVVVDPERVVRYIGGYTTRQQGPDIRDLAIVRELRGGDDISDLPVFGCGVSKRVQDLADPFSIKR